MCQISFFSLEFCQGQLPVKFHSHNTPCCMILTTSCPDNFTCMASSGHALYKLSVNGLTNSHLLPTLISLLPYNNRGIPKEFPIM